MSLITLQIIFPSNQLSGENLLNTTLSPDVWKKISYKMAYVHKIENSSIVMKVKNIHGTLKISCISLKNVNTGEQLISKKYLSEFKKNINVLGPAIKIPSRNQLALKIFGNEVSIEFKIDQDMQDCKLEINIWIKISLRQNEFLRICEGKPRKAESITSKIVNDFQSEMKSILNLWGFQNRFKDRSDEFEKISNDIPDKKMIKANTFWGADIYLLPKNEVVSSKIYTFGLFEPELCAFFIDFLFSGGVVLDIGAHIGFFSMLAAELVGKSGRVFSFEPTPSTSEVLGINIKPYKQVKSIKKIAWNTKTVLSFYDFGIQFSAFNTATKDRLSPEEKEKAVPNIIKAETISLDVFCKEKSIKPDLVKIDAESSEMFVLKGMTGLLDNIRPVTTIEVGDMESNINNEIPRSREILEFIMSFDYVPFNSIGGRYHYHTIKNEYDYDNIIMIPYEKLPIRKQISTIAVNRGKFF